jgi:hypothetical protein
MILFLSILITSCPIPTTSAKIVTPAVYEPKPWTVLVHFAIDNNIDYDYENDSGIVSNYLSTLESIEAEDVNNNIEIVVLMDCYNEDTQGEGYTSTFQDGYYHLTGGSFSDDLVVTKSEINSGSPSATEDFMDWAVTNYPAVKYMYSIFNHGGGFDDDSIIATYGIGFDDSDDDALSHYELGQTTAYLKGLTGKNIELFYPYACLMGGVELAYEVRNNVNYMLFSEELFPAALWSYEALDSISSDSGISGENLGIDFCDSAYDYFNNSWGFTLSLIDLSEIDSLYTAVDSYALEALDDIGSNNSRAAYYNRAADDAFTMDSSYYMDLGDYLTNVINESNIDSAVHTAAQNVLSAIGNAVVYETQYGYADATGISIFHNIWSSSEQYSITTYRNILTFGTNSWVEYLSAMETLSIIPEPDSYEEDDDYNSAIPLTVNGSTQDHTIHITGDVDYTKFDITEGSWYIIETHDNGGQSLDTELFLYNISQEQISYNDDSSSVYSLIIFECTESGTYYAAVRGYDDNETGDYSIDIQSTTANAKDSYEEDNDPATAKEILLGVSQDHNIHWSSDIDTLFFHALSGQSYTIEVTSDDILVEMYLFKKDEYTTELEYGYVGLNIHFTCTSDGDYYIAVVPYNGVGDYTIEVVSGTYSQSYNPEEIKKLQ